MDVTKGDHVVQVEIGDERVDGGAAPELDHGSVELHPRQAVRQAGARAQADDVQEAGTVRKKVNT